MRGWKLGKVEEVSWTSSGDGRPIYGVLVTPPALAPGVPSKTVVLAHGGPHDSWSSAWQGSWIDWAPMQIGRASCRARVCQYMYIAVDAGSLKKKTTNTKNITLIDYRTKVL